MSQTTLNLSSRTNRTDAASQPRALVQSSLAPGTIDLPSLVPLMYSLMCRNIATDGFTFSDPQAPGDYRRDAKPGAVIAAPSFPADAAGTDEDYVFNWVRDAAITAMEVARGGQPNRQAMLGNYVRFAEQCRRTAQSTPGHACFTIAGESRPWTEQNDGPALQTVAVLAAYDQLDPEVQPIAAGLINANVAFLLEVYQEPTTNLWEEQRGYSFFARAAQLRCFEEVQRSAAAGIAKPDGLEHAIGWLRAALAWHWDGDLYISMVADPSDGRDPSPQNPVTSGYDPNIDIVQACIYGGVPCTDTRLLATAARLRSQWEEGGVAFYPINRVDRAKGIGPMFGRYPGDVYDGDTPYPRLGGHPWAVSTGNVAELHYRLAAEIATSGRVPFDDLSAPFLGQSGVDQHSSPRDAAGRLIATGDSMLRAVVYHSDHFELSEQFDGDTGYERSVHNLTWSYAAYLSAVRARAAAV